MPTKILAQAIDTADQSSRCQIPESLPGLSCVWIVLPAYNEGENIGRLLQAIDQTADRARYLYRVLVVDDGSTDGTVDHCLAVSISLPVELLRHEVNEGLGVTLRDGLRSVTERAKDDDIIVTMDADMSHPPALVHALVQAITEGRDVVIASRFRSGAVVRGVPIHRQACSVVASGLFRLLRPVPGVRDFTCGYRAYRASLLRRAFAIHGVRFIQASGFDCMVEILMNLRQFQPVVGEVPLVLRYDWKGGVSKMQVWQTARRLLWHMVRRPRAGE